jgi:hypothetical protein
MRRHVYFALARHPIIVEHVVEFLRQRFFIHVVPTILEHGVDRLNMIADGLSHPAELLQPLSDDVLKLNASHNIEDRTRNGFALTFHFLQDVALMAIRVMRLSVSALRVSLILSIASRSKRSRRFACSCRSTVTMRINPSMRVRMSVDSFCTSDASVRISVAMIERPLPASPARPLDRYVE